MTSFERPLRKIIAITALTLFTTSIARAEPKSIFDPAKCDLVELEQNYESISIVNGAEMAALPNLKNVLQMNETQLKSSSDEKHNALGSFIAAIQAEGYSSPATLEEAFEGVDGGDFSSNGGQPDMTIYKIINKKNPSRTFYYFNLWSGGNAGGIISDLTGNNLVGGNSDGDLFCYE